jgi:hypothetical protein
LPGAGEQGVVGGRHARAAAFGAAVSAVVADRGVVGELGIGAGQQCLGGVLCEGLIPFQHQQVVGVQLLGDQPGGLLRRVSRIHAQHHPRDVQWG